jgi:hypothetical protein
MRSSFPGSPRVLKGAIVTVEPPLRPASVILFQYNPERLRRSIQPQAGRSGGSRAEVLRLKGAPVETIEMEVEVDAVDQIVSGNPMPVLMGVHPQLAALEALVHPHSSQIMANNKLLAAGALEIIPPEAPFTVLVWGPLRVVPVRLEGLSIEEEAYDPLLNPVRARVHLSLRVLTYDDLPLGHLGSGLSLARQVLRESMAGRGEIRRRP